MTEPVAQTISIVSVTYHTGPVLFRMLESAFAQIQLKEVILVDNGNPPEVVTQLRALEVKEPRLRLITGQGNIGFAAGVNLGARQATGDYLFMVNPDSVLPNNAAAVFLDNAQKFPRPALFGCRILDGNGHEQSGSRRDVLTPYNALSEVFKLYKIFPRDPRFARFNRHEDPLPTDTVPMPAISGAIMFVHRDDFWRVGGLDSGYFLHVDDIDFCLSFQRTGGNVYFIPALAVSHVGGSSDAPKLKVEYLKTKSFVRYFYKNFRSQPHVVLAAVTAATWTRFIVMAAKSALAPDKK